MNDSTVLRELATTFYFPRQPKIRSDQTKAQYGFAFDNFDAAIGRPATLGDLTEDSILAMISLLQSRGLAPKTVNERRGRINAIWSWLAKRGIVKTWPTVGPIPEPRRIPQAWSREQLGTLVDAAFSERGYIGSVPAGMWWGTLHLVAWESGERIGALMQAEWSMLDIPGRAMILPAEIRKGGRDDMRHRLTATTVNLLATIKSDRELIWEWPYDLKYVWLKYRGIRERAGLPTDRKSSFHRIRKSAASWLDAAGGDAATFLGHSSPEVARKSYIDPSVKESPAAADLLFRPGRDAS